MQNIRNHKVLAFFNFLAIFLIIIGTNTDFVVPDSGTSISGAIAAWGGFLLIVMLIITGVVVAKGSKKRSNNPGVYMNALDDARRQKKARITGISITLGALLGVMVVYLLSTAGSSENNGSDMAAGFIFIFLTPIFAVLGAFLLYALSQVSLGSKHESKTAVKYLLIVLLVIAALFGYSYYEEKYGQKYCDGQPLEEYQGELPEYCLNQ